MREHDWWDGDESMLIWLSSMLETAIVAVGYHSTIAHIFGIFVHCSWF